MKITYIVNNFKRCPSHPDFFLSKSGVQRNMWGVSNDASPALGGRQGSSEQQHQPQSCAGGRLGSDDQRCQPQAGMGGWALASPMQRGGRGLGKWLGLAPCDVPFSLWEIWSPYLAITEMQASLC